MSVDKTEKVVRDFLSNNSAEVLSIKGNWGVGKTYFWNKVLNQAKDAPTFCREKYCYISLFGITSLEQLKSTIFETYVNKAGIGEGFSFDNLDNKLLQCGRAYGAAIVRGSDKLLDKLSSGYIPAGLLASVLPFTFYLVKDMLICIDDLERKGDSLLMKDVLGLISSLKEERNCKVVLIYSDANFTKDDKEAYAHFREKVVDVEVKFAPLPKEAADLVFTRPDNIDTQLREFTSALKISNIRILQRIQKAAYSAIPLLQDFDEKLIREALQTLALFGWCYYSHDKEVPPYEYVKSLGYHRGGGKKTEQHHGWNALLEEYDFRETNELDVALSSLIENGFPDEELIRKEAEKVNERLSKTKSTNAFSEAWNIFYSFHDEDNEEKVVKTFADVLKQHVLHITPINLNVVIELLRELHRDKLASELIDFYVAGHINDKDIFDLSENLRSWGKEPDEELARKFNLQLAILEETPTVESVFAHLAKQGGWGWSPAQGEVLASATSDDFYRIFKSATQKTLQSYIRASLQYGQLDDFATERQLEITKKAKEALLRIGNESPLNKIRLKRFGISTEEQPRLPLITNGNTTTGDSEALS